MVYVRTAGELHQLFTGGKHANVKSLEPLSSDLIMAVVKPKTNLYQPRKGTSLVLAAFTTSAARVRLAQALMSVAPECPLLYADVCLVSLLQHRE